MAYVNICCGPDSVMTFVSPVPEQIVINNKARQNNHIPRSAKRVLFLDQSDTEDNLTGIYYLVLD